MSGPATNPSPAPAPGHLFAYGTLLPGEPRWHFLQPYVVDDGVADAVVGMLFDTGEGYPAAVFDATAGAPTAILGRVFELVVDRLDDALAVLDDVEGAVGGMYHRVEQVTVTGRAVWTYQYGGGLALRPIISGSWFDRG